MKKKKIDRLFCNDRKEYQALKNATTIFKKEELSKIFIIAMALGFNKKQRVPLKKSNRDDLTRISYLKEEQIGMIRALALKEEGNVEVLLDDEKIYSIAEEYANGGLKILKSLVIGEEPGSYVKKLCSELLEISKKAK